MKQYYTEGCLATSLCYLLKLKHTKDIERELLLKGMEREKLFLLEHVEYAAEKSGKKLTITVDKTNNELNRQFVKKLKNMNGKKVDINYEKINQEFIDRNLPAILLVDFKFFGNDTHYPHYLVVEERMDDHYKVMEPFSGKTSYVDGNLLFKAVSSVKNRLNYAPVIVKI